MQETGFGTYTVGTLCSNRLGYQKCLVHSSRGQDNVSRKKQDGSVVAITAPPVVKDYNNNMGAIDKNDQ